MLFVDDSQTQTVKYDRFLNQCVGSDDQVDVPRGDGLLSLALFFDLEASGQKLDAIGRISEPEFDIAGVLFGQNLCRRHERGLVPILDRDDHSLDGDYRLSAADVSLQQSVHRFVAGHIIDDLFQCPLLRVGRIEGQDCADSFANAIGDLDMGCLGLTDSLAATHAQSHGQPEELFEDQASVCRRPRLIVFLDRCILSGEVSVTQSLAERYDLATVDHFSRQ